MLVDVVPFLDELFDYEGEHDHLRLLFRSFANLFLAVGMAPLDTIFASSFDLEAPGELDRKCRFREVLGGDDFVGCVLTDLERESRHVNIGDVDFDAIF